MPILGRPSSFTQEIADRICDELGRGKSLRTICQSEEFPHIATIMRWCEAHEAFREQYARAREAQADFYAQEIVDIADDGTRDYGEDADGNRIVDHDHIARARLRVDARKWYASKVAPKKYGDTTNVAVTGALTLTLGKDDANVL